MTTPTVQPTTGITLGLRDLGHFASAFIGAFLIAWQAANEPTGKSALYALVPAAATVAFRQLFPNLGQTAVPSPVPELPAPPAPADHAAA